jgi:hypothetical protein
MIKVQSISELFTVFGLGVSKEPRAKAVRPPLPYRSNPRIVGFVQPTMH